MKYYILAFWKILKSWFVVVAILLDLTGALLTYIGELSLPSFIYIGILGFGFLFSCVSIIAKQLRTLENENPLVISNDNLSIGGSNMSIDSISIVNIGGGKAKITSITSDRFGKNRIIDNHYMETFILNVGANLNIMINESKIIDETGVNIKHTSSIVNDWKEPFFIYIWYESVIRKSKFCTKIKFQSGDKYIRNMGWEPITRR